MDILGGKVHDGMRAALVELVGAVDALHASDDVVSVLSRSGLNVRLCVAVAEAVRVLERGA
jgi:hypothetical protein